MSGYSNGCRCEICREGWREYMAARRRDRGVKPRATRGVAFYPGKDCNMSLSLTGLGYGILEAAQQRTGRSYGDIVERLLRGCGRSIAFDDVAKTG